MDKYIKRQEIRDALYDADAITIEGVKILNQFPAADVEPVRHGRCPICNGEKPMLQDCNNGVYIEVDAYQMEMTVWMDDECIAVFSIDYCPNCGAKLDKEG